MAVSLNAPGSLGSFTPAANPQMSAALARTGLSNGFRFTPSSAPGSRRAVTVAVRAQATTKAEASRTLASAGTSLTPSAYNLGVSIGWRRFALSGDIAKVVSGALPIGRESVDVGLSYVGRNWRTTLQVASDKSTDTDARMIEAEQSYSVDLGAAYEVTHNLAVTGGLRYQMRHDRLLSLSDDRRDAQAVYVGTAFKF